MMIGFALSLVGKACRARYATEIYLGQVTMFYLLPPSGDRTSDHSPRFPVPSGYPGCLAKSSGTVDLLPKVGCSARHSISPTELFVGCFTVFSQIRNNARNSETVSIPQTRVITPILITAVT